MKIPKYWARGEFQGKDESGKPLTFVACGWSFSSLQEAKTEAVARAKRVGELFARGQKPDAYGYEDRPVREEVLKDIGEPGNPIALITRNRYGALVLNANRVLFADVDYPKAALGGFLALFSRQRREAARQAAVDGTVRRIEARIHELGLGTRIHTSHIERLNGTLRGQQARLTRRTQSGSRRSDLLQKGLHLWQDLYNWVRIHGSLGDRTPAMALGLADHVWSVVEYVCHPVHVSDLQRDIWAEERNAAQESPLDHRFRNKVLPTS